MVVPFPNQEKHIFLHYELTFNLKRLLQNNHHKQLINWEQIMYNTANCIPNNLSYMHLLWIMQDNHDTLI